MLTLDYRGIGRSSVDGPAALEAQTSERLARDVAQLVAHLWAGGDAESRSLGGRQRLHVVGTSMGGMVAQQLALLLLRGGGGFYGSIRLALPRLCSLTLNATARSLGPVARFVPLGAPAYRRLLPLLLKADPAEMVRSVLSKAVPAEYLAFPHPRFSGKSIGDLWAERWVREYPEWFSYGDVDGTAAQARQGVGDIGNRKAAVGRQLVCPAHRFPSPSTSSPTESPSA